MKILQVCSYLYPALSYGGPARVVYDLSVELAQKHAVTVYTTDVWNAQRRILPTEKINGTKNFNVRYFSNILNKVAYTLRFFTGFGMVIAFASEWRRYDLVHIHDVFIIPQLMIGYGALFVKKPVVISPHGVLDPVRLQRRSLFKNIMWVFVKPLLVRASVIIATSEKEADALRNAGLSKIKVIYNGIPIHNSQKKSASSDNKRKLVAVYIGKLHPQKGLLELVEAYTSVYDKYTLIIAGPDDGARDDLLRYKKSRNLKKLELPGYIDGEEKNRLLKAADVFVYPSYAEGFSISILEALSYGIPVIITNECNFPDVQKHKAGIIVSAQALSENLSRALVKFSRFTSKERAAMSDQAKKLILEKYSIAQMSQSLVKLYDELT